MAIAPRPAVPTEPGSIAPREPQKGQSTTELTQRLAELRKAHADAQDSRRAALNLMEDAILSREALAEVNGALRESEERYRTLFELSPVAVYSCDSAGVIQKFNHRAAELWGREPAIEDTDERFCGSFRLFRPDGSFMPHDQCPMAGVLSGEISEARDAEVVIERPDNTRITVVVNIRPLKNRRGDVTGAINCFYDITERKRSEEAVRESEESHRTLFASAPMAVFACDRNGVIERYNQHAVELWGREPVCGVDRYCGAVKLWLPDGTLLPHAQSPVVDVLHTGTAAHNVELSIERPDGTRVPVMVNYAALRSPQGEITGAIISFMDITERKQNEKHKNLLMAELDHRVKNTLATSPGKPVSTRHRLRISVRHSTPD